MKLENTPELETERLVLRKFTQADIPDLFLIYGDEEVNRFLPWFPFSTETEAETFLRNELLVEYEKEVAYRYAIVLKEKGRAIGYVSLHGIDRETGGGDLGYGLRKEYRGRGIVAEASAAVLERLRQNGFHIITATHDVNNPASGRVMQKIGMRYSHSYDEQWQPKNFLVTFKLYQIDLQEGRPYEFSVNGFGEMESKRTL